MYLLCWRLLYLPLNCPDHWTLLSWRLQSNCAACDREDIFLSLCPYIHRVGEYTLLSLRGDITLSSSSTKGPIVADLLPDGGGLQLSHRYYLQIFNPTGGLPKGLPAPLITYPSIMPPKAQRSVTGQKKGPAIPAPKQPSWLDPEQVASCSTPPMGSQVAAVTVRHLTPEWTRLTCGTPSK